MEESCAQVKPVENPADLFRVHIMFVGLMFCNLAEVSNYCLFFYISSRIWKQIPLRKSWFSWCISYCSFCDADAETVGWKDKSIQNRSKQNKIAQILLVSMKKVNSLTQHFYQPTDLFKNSSFPQILGTQKELENIQPLPEFGLH